MYNREEIDMGIKHKGHSKKARHGGAGQARYRPPTTTKEKKMARRGRVKVVEVKRVRLVSSTGKVKTVREDSL